MGLFNKDSSQTFETETPQQRKEREMEERIERNMKAHGFDVIEGDENQRDLRIIVSRMIDLEDMLGKKGLSIPDMLYTQVLQQQALIEQNFVMIRLLDGVLKKSQ